MVGLQRNPTSKNKNNNIKRELILKKSIFFFVYKNKVVYLQ